MIGINVGDFKELYTKFNSIISNGYLDELESINQGATKGEVVGYWDQTTIEWAGINLCDDARMIALFVRHNLDSIDKVINFCPHIEWQNDEESGTDLIRKYLKPIETKEKKKKEGNKKMTNKNLFNVGFICEEMEVGLSMTSGKICLPTDNGGFAELSNDGITEVPKDFTMNFPGFVISTPIDQIAVGDIVKIGEKFAIVSATGKKLTITDTTGQSKQITPPKNMLTNMAMLPKVTNMMSGVTGSANGATGMFNNPLMIMAMMGKDSGGSNDLMKTMMMAQMFSGGGMFGQQPTAE